MTEASSINFISSTGEIWYCFLSVPISSADAFDRWMEQNLPNCRVFKFGEGPGQNYEIHGNNADERLLFSMRWT